MLRPDCTITITASSGMFTFKNVNDIQIETTWKNLTDSGHVILARKYKWEGQNIFSGPNPLIKAGDKINIKLGYNDILHEAFSGYITKINTEQEAKLTIEDSMFLLKKRILTGKMYTSISLKKLLQNTVTELPVELSVEIADMGKVIIDNGATPASVLKMLRETWKLESFVRDGKLYVGLPYPKQGSKLKFEFQESIIESNLDWFDSEQYPKFGKAIAIYLENNITKKTNPVYVGNRSGTQMTFHFYGKYSESELKALAENELKKENYTGFRGTFKSFGEPFVRHGDQITITDKKSPEKNGTYICKSVKYMFGVNGWFQEIELGYKIL